MSEFDAFLLPTTSTEDIDIDMIVQTKEKGNLMLHNFFLDISVEL